MAATLKQVADYTQLSIPTVSEILNNKSRFYKAETRQRVMEAARNLGYRPNSSARSMRSGRFGSIAILQSYSAKRNYLPSSLLNSIEAALSERNLLLLLGRVSDEQLKNQDTVPQLLKIWSADGLLINYIAGYPERMMELISHHHIPAMWLNSKHGSNCIYPEDEGAAFEATQHLIGLGHTQIAFVNYNFGDKEVIPVHYSSVDRYKGYSEAMDRARLLGENIRPEGTSLPMAERLEYSLRWLSRPERPTAVVAYNMEVVQPVLFAAKSLGMKIPGDLSVITFDDHVCDSLGTPIDTMILPEEEMGRYAVERLLEKIETPQLNFPPLTIPLKKAVGWTTAPPSHQSVESASRQSAFHPV
jgi:LacI family transcriptional regulator